MKKQIILSLLLVSLTVSANAADPVAASTKVFKTNADVVAESRALEVEQRQVQVDQLKASQDILVELQKGNAVNAEISAKLDKLIENSATNNMLMGTLLKRTE